MMRNSLVNAAFVCILTIILAFNSTDCVVYDRSSENIINITSISIPLDVTSADFGSNKFTFIPAGYLKNLTSLTVLHLENNDISHIASHAFSDVPSLIYLELDYNLLEEVRVDMFTNMSNLQNIDVKNNRIHTVQPLCFHGLPSIKVCVITRCTIYAKCSMLIYCRAPPLQGLLFSVD